MVSLPVYAAVASRSQTTTKPKTSRLINCEISYLFIQIEINRQQQMRSFWSDAMMTKRGEQARKVKLNWEQPHYKRTKYDIKNHIKIY